MSDTSWMAHDYPDPPPGWADDEYPTAEDREEALWEKADRAWDEDHDL